MRSLPLQRVLVSTAEDLGVRFQSGGAEVSPLLVFGDEAFMPAVALVAGALAYDLMGWSLGAKFAANPRSIFGIQVETQPVQARVMEGTVLGLMYSRAAAQCFDWSRGRVVDLHRVYHDFIPVMQKFTSREGLTAGGEVYRV